MKPLFKRALAAVAVIAVVAGIAPFLNAPAAFANGSLQGAATIKTAGGAANLQSADSNTTFTLRLPGGAACPGDSNVDPFYHWAGYFVSGAIDPATLQFNSQGPTGPTSGTYATFKQPLRTSSGGAAVIARNTAGSTPPDPSGPIVNIDDMSFATLADDAVPSGVYNIGIACYAGPASATQMSNFWNVQITVTDNANGTGTAFAWQNGTVPAAPTITATAATTNTTTGQMSVAITNSAANPSITSCKVYVSTTAAQANPIAGSPFTDTNCVTPYVVTGLAYGQQYFTKVSAVNAVGEGPQSTEANGTPVRPAVASLGAVPSPNQVALDWADQALKDSAETYTIDICTLPATSPCGANSAGHQGTAGSPSTTSATSDKTVTGLVAGQLYTFTVSYGNYGTSLTSSIQSTPLSNSILLQDITVGRPNGALVLTQVCGKWDQMAAETEQFGYPTGLPLSAASTTGTAPTTGASAGGPADGTFGQYPYPENSDGTANATYPTHCGITLGNAHLIARPGATGTDGAGQFFAANGRLNQVTVVDTRDTDQGWSVNFAMSDLSNASTSTAISGNELGWTAQRTQTAAFNDGYGVQYSQAVSLVNGAMTPNTQGAAGAGTAHSVISAASGHGLGIATLDARIKLLIPINARNGNYAGTLTINAL